MGRNASPDRTLHYVIARADQLPRKPAERSDYLKRPASGVEKGRRDPRVMLGHVPFAIGLLVVDIDTGKSKPVGYWREAVYESLGTPFREVRTGRGVLHLYYRTDQPVEDVSWEGGFVARLAMRFCGMRTEFWPPSRTCRMPNRSM